MIWFLLGLIVGWLGILTYLQFRRENLGKEIWKLGPVSQGTSIDPDFYVTEQRAEFIENDRISQIINGKDDVKLDDILI